MEQMQLKEEIPDEDSKSLFSNKCHICNMDVENLELHCLNVHKETPEVKPKIKVKTMENVFKCEKCNKSFKRKAYLKKHTLNFQCVCMLCKITFSSNQMRQHHLMSVCMKEEKTSSVKIVTNTLV